MQGLPPASIDSRGKKGYSVFIRCPAGGERAVEEKRIFVLPEDAWDAPAGPLRRREAERCLVFASWAELEREEGRLDAGALEILRGRLLRLNALGVEPVLCLYRGEDPAWFEARGGWEKEDNLRCYLRYVGRLVRAVGHLAAEYVTLFEPNELVWHARRRPLRQSFLVLSHMACVHVRAYRLIRDTRRQRGLEDTAVGFVLRMAPAVRLRQGLVLRRSRSTASGYQKLPLLAMAKGEFLFPLRNALRVRPGTWSDFIGVVCEEKDRARCRAEALELLDFPLRDVTEAGR